MVRRSRPKSHKQPDWTDSYIDVNSPNVAQPSRRRSSLFGKLARVWKSPHDGAMQQLQRTQKDSSFTVSSGLSSSFPSTSQESPTKTGLRAKDSSLTVSSGISSSFPSTSQESPTMLTLSQDQEESLMTPRQSQRSFGRLASNAGGVLPLLLAEEPDPHCGTFSPPAAPTPSLSAINTPTFESRSLGNSPAAGGRNDQLSETVQNSARAITNTSHSPYAFWCSRDLRPCSEDLEKETRFSNLDASSPLAVLNSNGTLADHVRSELGELRKQVHGLQGEIQSLRREQGALKGVLRFCSGGKIPVDFDGNRNAGRRPSDVLAQLVSSKPLPVAAASTDDARSRPLESTSQTDCCGREGWPLAVQGGLLDDLATATSTKLRRGFRVKRASQDNAGSDCTAMGAAVGADGLLDALWGTCMRAQRALTLDSATDVNDLMADTVQVQGQSHCRSAAEVADAIDLREVEVAANPSRHDDAAYNEASNSERSSTGSSTNSSSSSTTTTTSASDSSARCPANHRNDHETSLQEMMTEDSQASQAGYADMSDDAPPGDSCPSSAVGGYMSMLSRRGTTRVLRHCGLGLGQSVYWVASDEDVPQGHVGEVLGCSPAGILVRFPGGTWYFAPNELVAVSQPSATSSTGLKNNDARPEQVTSNENSPPGAVVAEPGEVDQAVTGNCAAVAAQSTEEEPVSAKASAEVRCSIGSSQAGVSRGWRRLDGQVSPAVEERRNAEAATAAGGGSDGTCSGSSAKSWHPQQQQGTRLDGLGCSVGTGTRPDGLTCSVGTLLLPFPELAQAEGGWPMACH